MNDELKWKDVGGREDIADTQKRAMMNSSPKVGSDRIDGFRSHCEIESIGLSDKFEMMTEGEGRIGNEADAPNFRLISFIKIK